MKRLRVAIIGMGDLGLVSKAFLAGIGHHVTCVDLNEGKIADLLAGRMPIFEPGLAGLMLTNLREGGLDFTCDLAASIALADLVFIAVGTARHGAATATQI